MRPIHQVRVTASLLATAVAAPLAAQEGEWVAQAPLEGFVRAQRGTDDDLSLVHYVPRGETRQAWTRAVIVQAVGDGGSGGNPRTYLERLAARLGVTCRGGRAEPIGELTRSELAAAQVEAWCPHNPRRNRPETFFMLVIEGRDALHAVTIAFRDRPTAAQRDFALRQLQSVELCHIGYWPAICQVPTVP